VLDQHYVPVQQNDFGYAEATGVIRAMEKRLLNASALGRVLDADSAPEALRLLTQISDYDFSALKRASDYERVLKNELRRVYALLRKLSPNLDVVEILSSRYDYHNVKVALKAQSAAARVTARAAGSAALEGSTVLEGSRALEGAAALAGDAQAAATKYMYDVTRVPPQSVIKAVQASAKEAQVGEKAMKASDKALQAGSKAMQESAKAIKAGAQSVQAGSFEQLPEHLEDAVEQGKAAYEKTGVPGSIDLELDRLMYEEMSRKAGRVGNLFIIEYVRKAIDFYNLKTLFRARAMGDMADIRLLGAALAEGGSVPLEFFLGAFPMSADAIVSLSYFRFFGDVVKAAEDEHGRSGSYALLERLADNFLMNLARRAKMVAYGPEPLFAYLCAKETELKQVRVTITGKLNQIPNESIRKRLRECYA
jgi:vacuolar-type H+-ATPase subunit C/Vma6